MKKVYLIINFGSHTGSGKGNGCVEKGWKGDPSHMALSISATPRDSREIHEQDGVQLFFL